MIPRLEDMSLGHRIALTAAIVIIILLLLAAFGYFTGNWDQADAQSEPPLYGDTPLDAVLIRLDKRALDNAYEQTLIKGWEVWLSPTTRDAAAFANRLKIARQRYSEAASAISRRERIILDQERAHQDQQK